MNETDNSELWKRLSDRQAIQQALRRAAKEAVLSHAQAGKPIAVWEDGRVVWIQPAEILALYGTAHNPTIPVAGTEISPEAVP